MLRFSFSFKTVIVRLTMSESYVDASIYQVTGFTIIALYLQVLQ